MLPQSLRFLARQPRSQVGINLLRDVSLHRQQVGHLPVILIAPQLRSVRHVHKVRVNRNHVAALRNLAHQQRIHIQLFAYLLCIDLVPLVAEHRAAGHYLQLRHPRQAADHSVSHSIRNIFDIRIRAAVDERQHRDGANLSAACNHPLQPCTRSHCQRQKQHRNAR